MIGALIIRRKVPAGLDAMNRHDLEAWLKNWVDDATFIYPGDVALSGTYTGKAAIRAFFERFFVQFPTLHFRAKHITIKNLFDITGTNVVAVHYEVDAINRDGVAIQNSGIALSTIRWGKVVRLQEFIFNTGKEFRAAWGETSLGER